MTLNKLGKTNSREPGLFTFRQLFPAHWTHLGPIRQNTVPKKRQIYTIWTLSGHFLKNWVIFLHLLAVFGQKMAFIA